VDAGALPQPGRQCGLIRPTSTGTAFTGAPACGTSHWARATTIPLVGMRADRHMSAGLIAGVDAATSSASAGRGITDMDHVGSGRSLCWCAVRGLVPEGGSPKADGRVVGPSRQFAGVGGGAGQQIALDGVDAEVSYGFEVGRLLDPFRDDGGL
jgi:hypothetical protein